MSSTVFVSISASLAEDAQDQFARFLAEFGNDQRKAAAAVVAGLDGSRIVRDAERQFGDRWADGLPDNLKRAVRRAVGLVL